MSNWLQAVAHSPAEELLVPFPSGSRAGVRPATQFRSTWLSSSLRALRERDRLAAYLGHLPRQHHEAVLSTVVGVWLPIDVGIAHYAACDALAFSPAEILAIGREATSHVHGTLLSTFVRLAKGAGATPWTVLVRIQELWARIWVGGGVSVSKLGPKEARVEVAGWPCAASPYCRVAMRGVIPALMELFCQRSYAKELPSFTTSLSVGFVVSWA